MLTGASLKETVLHHATSTGVLPCIKVKRQVNALDYAQAMYDGGARVVEITMTTPGALEAVAIISKAFAGRMWVAAGTVLDPTTARQVILNGGSLIVSPTVRPQVIKTAGRYGVPIFSGAFTATECQIALEAGASMVKIFPAKLGGPSYMTNLKMVFPEIQLCPSGGINIENAADYIRCGASAVSGARTFMDGDKIESEGLGWITQHVARFIDVVRRAKKDQPELP